jgi:hypothetical protein
MGITIIPPNTPSAADLGTIFSQKGGGGAGGGLTQNAFFQGTILQAGRARALSVFLSTIVFHTATGYTIRLRGSRDGVKFFDVQTTRSSSAAGDTKAEHNLVAADADVTLGGVLLQTESLQGVPYFVLEVEPTGGAPDATDQVIASATARV